MKKYAFLPYFLVVISGLSTDIYMPSMPAMTSVFHASMSQIQYSITFFVAGLGLAQLFAGPVSDALGRKPLMIISLAIQMVAILTILSSQNIYVLWFARLIQGLAVAFLSVPARAILNDCYDGLILKKKFITMTTAFGLGPIIAPFVGGLSEQYYGWQLSFMLLLAYLSMAFFYILFYFQETMTNQQAFKISMSFKNYGLLINHKAFMLMILLLCCVANYNNFTITMGSFLFQDRFHLSALAYGKIALLVGLGWFLGNLFSRLLFNVCETKRFFLAFSLQGILVSALLGASLFDKINVTFLVISFFLYSLSASFIFGALVGNALSLFPKIAASANGFLFSCLWLFFGLASFMASCLPISNLCPLAIVFIVNWCASLWVLGRVDISLAKA